MIAIIASIFLAIWLVLPGPPKILTIATGFLEGLYYQFATQLQAELAKQKITLRIWNAGGSADNLALMADPKSRVI